MHIMICATGVFSREIISILSLVMYPGLFKTFSFRIYSDTITVINVKLCMMVLLIELYLFGPLSMTVTIFQGHSNVKQF